MAWGKENTWLQIHWAIKHQLGKGKHFYVPSHPSSAGETVQCNSKTDLLNLSLLASSQAFLMSLDPFYYCNNSSQSKSDVECCLLTAQGPLSEGGLNFGKDSHSIDTVLRISSSTAEHWTGWTDCNGAMLIDTSRVYRCEHCLQNWV